MDDWNNPIYRERRMAQKWAEAEDEIDRLRAQVEALKAALIALREDGRWEGDHWVPSDKAEAKADAALREEE
jgi:hypothetical protein